METDYQALVISVFGDVQRVGYRNWTRREANARGLRGWVRNRRNTVQVAVWGPPEPLAAFLLACVSGPRRSAVTRVSFRSTSNPPPSGFRIRKTV